MNFESFEWMDVKNAKALYISYQQCGEKCKGEILYSSG